MADIRSRIPEGVPVVVNGGFTTRFAARKEIVVWGWRDRSRPLEEYGYVVLDGRFVPEWLVDKARLARDIAELGASPAWSTEYARDSLYLFRHKARGRGEGAPAP